MDVVSIECGGLLLRKVHRALPWDAPYIREDVNKAAGNMLLCDVQAVFAVILCFGLTKHMTQERVRISAMGDRRAYAYMGACNACICKRR